MIPYRTEGFPQRNHRPATTARIVRYVAKGYVELTNEQRQEFINHLTVRNLTLLLNYLDEQLHFRDWLDLIDHRSRQQDAKSPQLIKGAAFLLRPAGTAGRHLQLVLPRQEFDVNRVAPGRLPGNARNDFSNRVERGSGVAAKQETFGVAARISARVSSRPRSITQVRFEGPVWSSIFFKNSDQVVLSLVLPGITLPGFC